MAPEEILRDSDLIGWFIDSDIDRDPADPVRLANAEPLLVNPADGVVPRPAWRPVTGSEHRGLAAGRPSRDLLLERR